MIETIEDHLIDSDQTWSEFCVNPYPLLETIKGKKVVYCESKEGHFVFERNKIISVLTDDQIAKKKFSVEDPNNEIANFFSKWIFFREDNDRERYKRELFRSIQFNNKFGVLDFSHVSEVDELYGLVRRYLFENLVRIFFYCTDESIDRYYQNSEAIYSYFQGDRPIQTDDILGNIRSINSMFDEPKVFEFDRAFFESSVLNAIIDGYEPIADICWNTVEILMAKDSLSSDIAYKIAISTLPSFRYVVRHLENEIEFEEFSISGKIYCFLSESVLFDDPEFHRGVQLGFGRGRHVCAGRGLVERIVPGLAAKLCEYLKQCEVQSVRLVRHDSLGSEGVAEVIYER